jgi:hypothetical protein
MPSSLPESRSITTRGSDVGGPLSGADLAEELEEKTRIPDETNHRLDRLEYKEMLADIVIISLNPSYSIGMYFSFFITSANILTNSPVELCVSLVTKSAQIVS